MNQRRGFSLLEVMVSIGIVAMIGVLIYGALGTAIGAYASTNDPSALPFQPSKIDQIPFHGLREPFMAIAFAWNRAMDRLGW